MAQPAPAQPPKSSDPIRQQLDELDALLQRMLNLPVNSTETDAPPAELSAASSPPVAEDPAPPLPPLPPLPPPRTILAPPTPPPEPTPEPTFSEPPRPISVSPTAPRRRRRPIYDVTPPRPEPIISPWLLPLVTLNRGFDTFVGYFGPFGRWLRRPWGRAVLGWIGVLCLIAALALILLDWLGWTW